MTIYTKDETMYTISSLKCKDCWRFNTSQKYAACVFFKMPLKKSTSTTIIFEIYTALLYPWRFYTARKGRGVWKREESRLSLFGIRRIIRKIIVILVIKHTMLYGVPWFFIHLAVWVSKNREAWSILFPRSVESRVATMLALCKTWYSLQNITVVMKNEPK